MTGIAFLWTEAVGFPALGDWDADWNVEHMGFLSGEVLTLGRNEMPCTEDEECSPRSAH